MSTPESLYRNAIDLNRYSNSVARRIINAYNDIIIDAVNQLRTIDDLAAPVKAARLRGILAQLKESLATWAGDSTEITAIELQGLAELQSQFVADQLAKALPAGARDAVRTVEISPQFAQAVVTADPTQINVVALSDDLYKSVYGAAAQAAQVGTGTFSLTAAKGAMITLPNGRVVEKAFRGIAVDQAERFSQVVRNGLLTGETTPSIAKRLIGGLQFGEEARSVRQLIAAGGQATAVADGQVMALVRTSINQVANAAAMQTYEANQDITKRYRYVATLDSRTSAICRALDGKEFEYGKGPTPPQHFNCLPGDALVTPCGRIAAVYRRHYQGLLCVISTSDGHVLRVTPNHPVLTGSGWKPAQGINVGDKVFSCSAVPNKLVHQDNKGDAVTTAEDVFRAFRESPSVIAVEVPTTAPDFHGDAWGGGPRIDLAKQIAVVLADRELLFAVNPGLLKALHDRSLVCADSSAPGLSHLDLGGLGVGPTAPGGMSGGGQCETLVGSGALHSGELLLTPVSQLPAGLQNDPLYGSWRDVELVSNPLDADTIVVSGNDQVEVAWVGWEPFSGHVYNFETESGTYWANRILTHNCRSTIVAVITDRLMPPSRNATRASADGQVPIDTTYGDWLLKQGKAMQDEVLGPRKAPYFRTLAEKHGPQNALAKMISEDGSELTLQELKRKYGTP